MRKILKAFFYAPFAIYRQNELIMSKLQDLQAILAAISANVQILASQAPLGGLSAADVASLSQSLDELNAAVVALIQPQP